MNRAQGWALGFAVSFLMWCLIIGGTCALVGCDGGLGEGVLLGIGASTTASEASDMAKENKTALIAKILKLQQELDAAATPEQQAALQAELDAAKKKQEIVELTAAITDKIKEGINRDWGDKPMQGEEGVNNLAYIMTAIAGIATTYAGKKTYEVVQKDKAIKRVEVASKSGDLKTGDVYKAINGA